MLILATFMIFPQIFILEKFANRKYFFVSLHPQFERKGT